MPTTVSIQWRITGNKSVRILLSTLLLLALLFASLPVPHVQAASSWTVTKNTDTDDGVCDRDCSLREAIDAANSGDTIVFSRGQTFTLRSQLTIDTRLTIRGKGSSKTIIQASKCNPISLSGGCRPASQRVFEIERRGNLTLDGVTVRNGNCAGSCSTAEVDGGGIYNAGTLSLKNSIVQNNRSDWAGGGIYNEVMAKLTVTNSTITSNQAEFSGGGIYSVGSATLSNSSVSSNYSASYGGGVANGADGRLTVNNSAIHNNAADYNGAGLYSEGALVKASGSSFYQNIAGNFGGAIHNAGLEITMKNCTVTENGAYHGGGIYNVSTLTVTGSTFDSNRARRFEGFGGAIHNEAGTLTVIGTLLSGNLAYMGGGISNTGTLEVMESTFSYNTANYLGGGISNSSTAYVTDTDFFENSATDYGGGIWNGSWISVTNGSFSGNSAPYGPGLSDDGTAYLTNTVPDN